jgi:hypothetical protein
MAIINVSRRQVLRGAQGFTLGLPFLPSLVARSAFGVDFALGTEKRFVGITNYHGGCNAANMWPDPARLTNTTNIYPAHAVKHGALMGVAEGAGLRLSNVMRAAALTPKLLAKMNALRGCFDFPYYSGHHGGQLGNFADNDQGPAGLTPFPSIDQVMAWSPFFYKNTAGITARSMTTGRGGSRISCSFGWANPQAKSGAVTPMPVEQSSVALFNKALGALPPASAPTTKPRVSIIGRVKENYKSLRESNRRLSKEDRTRLDAHIARLAELERTLKVTVNRSCGSTTKPTDDSAKYPEAGMSGRKFYGLMNDVIAAAFACGSSRIATVSIIPSSFHTVSGSYHQDIAHQHESPGPQLVIRDVHQQMFEFVFVDLASKLDAIEVSPGRTLLDDALVQWTEESGTSTHAARDGIVLTAGSAGGFFKTGNYVDYRGTKKFKIFGSFETLTLGLLHRQWLATALLAMGVPASEWERPGKTGYGDNFQDPGYTTFQLPEVAANASKPIPIVTNT